MTPPQIAIVGMACEYPDARTPRELWENVLARRQAFRPLPPERLNPGDHFSPHRDAADRTYSWQAAVLRDYDFDRVRYRVSGESYRASDPAHWLALDVAARALDAAGFPDGLGLPGNSTGVYLGNTLTGDFSRAQSLRLRWPYVRRTVDKALAEEGWAPPRRREFLSGLETSYKCPFAPVGPETLAGGLSNTIAGRICNNFDLGGGGSTVDGACASSLLAVAQGCTALAVGDLDVVLAGGVDLSLDPFELVGFAKAGALGATDMRVYDAKPQGFFPGEGCGMVVLMRLEDARAARRRVLAVVSGWGVSSDGRGGITRPEVAGQQLALARAYRRAGYGVDSVAYFEGHGTGTEVGDAIELRALGRSRSEANPSAPPAAIGSVKANIGHTKAAAGVAGLIKSVMALEELIIPPITGCIEPHADLTGSGAMLKVPFEAEPWPGGSPPRAGVSAMGFGGINAHVVLQRDHDSRSRGITPGQARLLGSLQDAELFLLAAPDAFALRSQIGQLRAAAEWLSRSELTDAAAALANQLGPAPGPVRAAIVASTPEELAQRLEQVVSELGDVSTVLHPDSGVFLGTGREMTAVRIGFLFPGQGSGTCEDGGVWVRRFPSIRELYRSSAIARDQPADSTARVQSAIVASSLAGLAALDRWGIDAEVAVGHSLGELVAIHWGGAIGFAELLGLVQARGKAMAGLGGFARSGAMVSVGLDHERAANLAGSGPVVIAGINSPLQTVLSGPAPEVELLIESCRRQGITATRLPVADAFHSPQMAGAVPVLATALRRLEFSPFRRKVVSTVTGGPLDPNSDLPALLCHQLTAPVRFAEAISASGKVDLWIEVGPGEVLGGITRECGMAPVISLDAGGRSLRGLLSAAAAAFVLGIPLKTSAIFADRLTRPLDLARRPRFLANPCELAPSGSDLEPGQVEAAFAEPAAPPILVAAEVGSKERVVGDRSDILGVVRRLIADRAELPVEAVQGHQRLLGDLHLNSITVSQIVVDASREVGRMAPVVPARYASVTVAEVARAHAEQPPLGDAGDEVMRRSPPGIESWVRAFSPRWVEAERPRDNAGGGAGRWSIHATKGHPLEAALRRAFSEVEGIGTVVALPTEPDDASLATLLDAALAALAAESGSRFVVVANGGPWSAFAKSVYLEAPRVVVTVVDVPEELPGAADIVAAETRAALGFSESRYDSSGRRFVPLLHLANWDPEGPTGLQLGASDVVIVTGGGRGIAAECALALANRTGVKLGLIGRSDPSTDGALAANLLRLEAAGVVFHYARADVTDESRMRQAVAAIEERLGPATGILHAAGVNEPRAVVDLDGEAIRATLQPKVRGLELMLEIVQTDRLKVLVTFGSVIARAGMRGEAHYALANAWQTILTERFHAGHPWCRCLALEWSVWASVGMGERLGRVEALAREGVQPITVEQGTEWFLRLLEEPTICSTFAITGRIGDLPTLQFERPPAPSLRFLERVLVDQPGVELVAEAEISSRTDPYLDDHVFQGERLLPAVIGLEAMSQAVVGLCRGGCSCISSIENVTFDRPVTIADGPPTVVRLAALARGRDRVEVALRCSTTSFRVDHFRAVYQLGAGSVIAIGECGPVESLLGPMAQVDPARDLYGTRLFQSGRFRLLRGYRHLSAYGCHAVIESGNVADWHFGSDGSPPILGDPGLRDAAIHSLQACIPQIAILPMGVDRIVVDWTWPLGPRHLVARERSCAGGVYIYDLTIYDESGDARERWEGLRLKGVIPIDDKSHWPRGLVAPYLERRLRELLGGVDLSVSIESGEGTDGDGRTERVLSRALGKSVFLTRRPDGKPDAQGGRQVSSSHTAATTLAVTSPLPVGCDIEPLGIRSETEWINLLGPELYGLVSRIASEIGGDLADAATRVWAAAECLLKVGCADVATLVHARTSDDGWCVLHSGGVTIAVNSLAIAGDPSPLALAVAVRNGDCPAPGQPRRHATRAFEYRHVVGLEESNLVGNVYFVNHLRWQGRCRELFMRDHAPSLLDELQSDLALVTTSASCKYLRELAPFDEVSVRMSLSSLGSESLSFRFDYFRVDGGNELLVAWGEQTVACMRRLSSGLQPCPIPAALIAALSAYA